MLISLTLFALGTITEIRYQLSGLGIPVDFIPLTDTGNVKTKQLSQWLNIRKVVESISINGNIVECPFASDVLFKSGSKSIKHRGNTTFRRLVEARFLEHSNTRSSGVKLALSWQIVDEIILVHHGRFLEWDKHGWWTVIEDRVQVRAKVASALREFKKQQRAFENRQITTSSTFDFERQDGVKRKRTEYSGDNDGCNACG